MAKALSQQHNSLLVNEIRAEVLCTAIDLMRNKSSEVHANALRFVSQVFSSNNSFFIDLALEKDVLRNFDDLLGSPST